MPSSWPLFLRYLSKHHFPNLRPRGRCPSLLTSIKPRRSTPERLALTLNYLHVCSSTLAHPLSNCFLPKSHRTSFKMKCRAIFSLAWTHHMLFGTAVCDFIPASSLPPGAPPIAQNDHFNDPSFSLLVVPRLFTLRVHVLFLLPDTHFPGSFNSSNFFFFIIKISPEVAVFQKRFLWSPYLSQTLAPIILCRFSYFIYY